MLSRYQINGIILQCKNTERIMVIKIYKAEGGRKNEEKNQNCITFIYADTDLLYTSISQRYECGK